jgi:hypothetical protein
MSGVLILPTDRKGGERKVRGKEEKKKEEN